MNSSRRSRPSSWWWVRCSLISRNCNNGKTVNKKESFPFFIFCLLGIVCNPILSILQNYRLFHDTVNIVILILNKGGQQDKVNVLWTNNMLSPNSKPLKREQRSVCRKEGRARNNSSFGGSKNHLKMRIWKFLNDKECTTGGQRECPHKNRGERETRPNVVARWFYCVFQSAFGIIGMVLLVTPFHHFPSVLAQDMQSFLCTSVTHINAFVLHHILHNSKPSVSLAWDTAFVFLTFDCWQVFFHFVVKTLTLTKCSVHCSFGCAAFTSEIFSPDDDHLPAHAKTKANLSSSKSAQCKQKAQKIWAKIAALLVLFVSLSFCHKKQLLRQNHFENQFFGFSAPLLALIEEQRIFLHLGRALAALDVLHFAKCTVCYSAHACFPTLPYFPKQHTTQSCMLRFGKVPCSVKWKANSASKKCSWQLLFWFCFHIVFCWILLEKAKKRKSISASMATRAENCTALNFPWTSIQTKAKKQELFVTVPMETLLFAFDLLENFSRFAKTFGELWQCQNFIMFVFLHGWFVSVENGQALVTDFKHKCFSFGTKFV